MARCPTCNGNGVVRCETCKGKGSTRNPVTGPVDCSKCDGGSRRCGNCGGTGKI
jgi:hypothetical protein